MRLFLIIIITIFLMKTINAQKEMFCRYENGGIYYGKVEENKVYQLDKAPWFNYQKTGKVNLIKDVKLLHPTEPQVILGLGGAYKNNWIDKTPPKTVRWFLKPPSAAASHNDEVVLPHSIDEVKVETELVIIIGKTVKNADEHEAALAIFGYTLGNDIVGNLASYLKVNEESEESAGPLLAPGLKIGDRFAPYGPFIYTGIEWENRDWSLTVENKATGKKNVHIDNTSNLVNAPAKIVSDLSKFLTLNPGDIIFTGTSKSLLAVPGDLVTVEIEGLGFLINNIVR